LEEKMKRRIAVFLDADIKKETFSFDELVIRAKEVFDKDGIPGVIRECPEFCVTG